MCYRRSFSGVLNSLSLRRENQGRFATEKSRCSFRASGINSIDDGNSFIDNILIQNTIGNGLKMLILYFLEPSR